ncbi:MAG: DUF5119 domain-containing protein [Paramuribaculum sp.]|nr:DUF5119 domain-containing protein [Paramuribaculum sp.]MDE7152240.1 DUF5119 domain-containing protein [Candidatus Amulumruptor sp.]
MTALHNMMKSIFHTIKLWLACATVLTAGTGCRHHEIGYPSRDMTEMHLVFEDDSERRDSIDGLTVTLFPRESDLNRWVYELAGATGGDVAVPCGDYDMLAYDNNPGNIFFGSTDRFDTYTATTRQVSSPARTGSGNDTHEAPDPIYSAIATEINLTPCCVDYVAWSGGKPLKRKDCVYRVVRGRLRLITPRVTCIIEKLGETAGIGAAQGMIGGVYDSILVAYGEPTGNEVEMTFGLGVADSSSVTGTFNIFGRVNGEPNMLYLYLTMKNGETRMFKADVTALMDAAADPMDITIRLDGPDLSQSDPSGPEEPGTFDPTVSTWQEVIINITN